MRVVGEQSDSFSPIPGANKLPKFAYNHEPAPTLPAACGTDISVSAGAGDGICGRMHDQGPGRKGKEYIDLTSGISVCNMGHRHPKVVQAIKDQADRYLQLLVYGEFVETPQVGYACLLAAHLPPSLDFVYFINSGTEATEGAMKLAKRITGRTFMVAFHQSYHGFTQGP